MPGRTVCVTFLSTLSLRRATALGLPGWLRVLISIHALLAESDSTTLTFPGFGMISIHALLAESDYRISKAHGRTPAISIHALLAESDEAEDSYKDTVTISIHALLAESDR